MVSLLLAGPVSAEFFRPCHNGRVGMAAYLKEDTYLLAEQLPGVPVPFCETGEFVQLDLLANGYGGRLIVRLRQILNCGQYTDMGDGRVFLSARFSSSRGSEDSFSLSYDPENGRVEASYTRPDQTYDYDFSRLVCDPEDFLRTLFIEE